MAEKSAISAAPRRRLFIVQIDVPRKLKKSKTIPQLKVQKVRKICYAAAGLSRYMLINVAPSSVLSITGALYLPLYFLCHSGGPSIQLLLSLSVFFLLSLFLSFFTFSCSIVLLFFLSLFSLSVSALSFSFSDTHTHGY